MPTVSFGRKKNPEKAKVRGQIGKLSARLIFLNGMAYASKKDSPAKERIRSKAAVIRGELQGIKKTRASQRSTAQKDAAEKLAARKRGTGRKGAEARSSEKYYARKRAREAEEAGPLELV